jgi:hypothetical protein
MDKLESLEKRLDAIEKRNSRVEADKAWEGSLTRKLLIIVLTYLVIASYLYFIVGIDPWINAIVPAFGFFLSTLTLPFVKNLWIEYLYKN